MELFDNWKLQFRKSGTVELVATAVAIEPTFPACAFEQSEGARTIGPAVWISPFT